MVLLASRPPPPPVSFGRMSESSSTGLPPPSALPFPAPPPPGQSQDRERELLMLYSAVTDLGEQLARNRASAADLLAQAGRIRSQAAHAQSGYPLRRFNLNLSEEAYEAELGAMTDAIRGQNVELAQDNKQLSSLIREHEATLEMVMTSFRVSALKAQEHELAIARTYERAIMARDNAMLDAALGSESRTRLAITKISQALRAAHRIAHGEEPPAPARPDDDPDSNSPPLPGDEEREAHDTLERECELARLERENADLRRMLGQPVPDYPYQLDPPSRLVGLSSPSICRAGKRLPSLSVRTSGVGSRPGLGMGMGLALSVNGASPTAEWSPDMLWRDEERARDAREALLS